MNTNITYCTGDGCNKKEQCLRYMTVSPDRARYYFSKPPFKRKIGGQSCCHFKPIG